MRATKRRDTKPELQVRRALHRSGYRFRVDHRIDGLNVRPDIVFTRQMLAVFIDGCFWHGCPEHYQQPVANADFWRKKLVDNLERDRRNDYTLSKHGWTVLRFWEHTPPDLVARSIIDALRSSPSPL